jgi:hypothetical protein
MATTHSHQNGARISRPRAGRRAGLEHLMGASRRLPRQVQTAMKAHPAATLAAVAAGSFVLGALVGSPLGRLALAAAVPVLVRHAIDGDLRERLAALAKSMDEVAGGAHQGDA